MAATDPQGVESEGGIDSRTAAREGARVLLFAFAVGAVSGAATWLFLFIDHHGVKFLWETLPERFSTVPAWVPSVAVVLAMTAVAALIALACKGRPFDVGGAEHEYDTAGRMEYRRILPGAAFSLASLFSGAAVGPEAPLVDINGGLGTLVAEKFRLRPNAVKVMTYAGVAGALGAFLGSAPVGAILAMEFISPKDSSSLSRTDMVAGLASAASAWATYSILGGERFAVLFPFPEYTSLSYIDLGYAVAIGIVGGVAGLAYGATMVKTRVKLQGLREKPLLAGVAGGAVTAIAAVVSPYLLFSGQSQVPTVIDKAATLGILALLGIGVAKVALSIWGLSTAYFGGPLFPLIFTGLCFGLALNLAIPGVPQGVACMAFIVGMLVSATVSPLGMTIFLAVITNPLLASVIAIAAVSAYLVRQLVAPTLPGVYRQTMKAERN